MECLVIEIKWSVVLYGVFAVKRLIVFLCIRRRRGESREEGNRWMGERRSREEGNRWMGEGRVRGGVGRKGTGGWEKGG